MRNREGLQERNNRVHYRQCRVSRLSVYVSKQHRSPSPKNGAITRVALALCTAKADAMVEYDKLHTEVNLPENPLTRKEARAALNLLQQGFNDQTKKTE